MTDKPAKAKKRKKSAPAQEGVLASLPSTRPQRIGGRASAGTTAKGTTTAKPKPKPAPAAKAKPKATRSTAASRAATAEKAQRRAARASAPSPPPPQPPPPREPRKRSSPPQGPELVKTALQAAGEIAQIGITVGGQVLKRAAKRMPRP
jgi:hypothetical protein